MENTNGITTCRYIIVFLMENTNGITTCSMLVVLGDTDTKISMSLIPTPFQTTRYRIKVKILVSPTTTC